MAREQTPQTPEIYRADPAQERELEKGVYAFYRATESADPLEAANIGDVVVARNSTTNNYMGFVKVASENFSPGWMLEVTSDDNIRSKWDNHDLIHDPENELRLFITAEETARGKTKTTLNVTDAYDIGRSFDLPFDSIILYTPKSWDFPGFKKTLADLSKFKELKKVAFWLGSAAGVYAISEWELMEPKAVTTGFFLSSLHFHRKEQESLARIGRLLSDKIPQLADYFPYGQDKKKPQEPGEKIVYAFDKLSGRSGWIDIIRESAADFSQRDLAELRTFTAGQMLEVIIASHRLHKAGSHQQIPLDAKLGYTVNAWAGGKQERYDKLFEKIFENLGEPVGKLYNPQHKLFGGSNFSTLPDKTQIRLIETIGNTLAMSMVDAAFVANCLPPRQILIGLERYDKKDPEFVKSYQAAALVEAVERGVTQRVLENQIDIAPDAETRQRIWQILLNFYNKGEDKTVIEIASIILAITPKRHEQELPDISVLWYGLASPRKEIQKRAISQLRRLQRDEYWQIVFRLSLAEIPLNRDTLEIFRQTVDNIIGPTNDLSLLGALDDIFEGISRPYDPQVVGEFCEGINALVHYLSKRNKSAEILDHLDPENMINRLEAMDEEVSQDAYRQMHESVRKLKTTLKELIDSENTI